MKILVQGLEFVGYQGVTAEERTVGHRFKLDMVGEVTHPKPGLDKIEETVDYAKMATAAVRLCLARKDSTLEAACERIGNGLLEQFPLLSRVTLTLVKCQPSLDLVIRSVGVEMCFDRED